MRWRIRLQVRYRRRTDLVVAALAFAALLVGGLALGQRQATAETANAAEAVERGFYLSLATFQGDQVRLACAPGYHFASLWEIVDTSNLRYNNSLGKTTPDSGAGPPTAPRLVGCALAIVSMPPVSPAKQTEMPGPVAIPAQLALLCACPTPGSSISRICLVGRWR